LSNWPTYNFTFYHHVSVDIPSSSGSIPYVILFINVEANLGFNSKLLKNLKTAFCAKTCTVAWFAITYKKLRLVSYSQLKTHLIILRRKISTLEKSPLVGVNVYVTSLIHAYITLPYNNTLLTSAFIICNLTLTFVMPSIRQLVYTALKTLFAADNLAIMILSGFTEAFEISTPKYLNYYTVLISSLHTYIY
jgi:hypothetical protein